MSRIDEIRKKMRNGGFDTFKESHMAIIELLLQHDADQTVILELWKALTKNADIAVPKHMEAGRCRHCKTRLWIGEHHKPGCIITRHEPKENDNG